MGPVHSPSPLEGARGAGGARADPLEGPRGPAWGLRIPLGTPLLGTPLLGDASWGHQGHQGHAAMDYGGWALGEDPEPAEERCRRMQGTCV